jgi:hypothetical protein
VNITGIDQWDANVGVIDDGDVCGNAEHLATAQSLANRTTHLRTGVPGKATTYRLAIPFVANGNSANKWANDPGNSTYVQIDVLSQGDLTFHIWLPPTGKLTEVRAVLYSETTHVGLPANMPKLDVYRVAYTLGVAGKTETLIGSTTDPSATVADYEKTHEIAVNGLNETLGAGKVYHARLKGESGANALVNLLTLIDLYCTVTPP